MCASGRALGRIPQVYCAFYLAQAPMFLTFHSWQTLSGLNCRTASSIGLTNTPFMLVFCKLMRTAQTAGCVFGHAFAQCFNDKKTAVAQIREWLAYSGSRRWWCALYLGKASQTSVKRHGLRSEFYSGPWKFWTRPKFECYSSSSVLWIVVIPCDL